MNSPSKAVVDHHVDRPGVEAERSVQLTGTNSLIGLIALIYQYSLAVKNTDSDLEYSILASDFASPAWWH